MFSMLVTNSKAAKAISSGRGNFIRSAPMMPRPVIMPTRAHIICAAAMSGHVTSGVQSIRVPNVAPAIVNVAIADGSSSDAPAMSPGPTRAR